MKKLLTLKTHLTNNINIKNYFQIQVLNFLVITSVEALTVYFNNHLIIK